MFLAKVFNNFLDWIRRSGVASSGKVLAGCFGPEDSGDNNGCTGNAESVSSVVSALLQVELGG